MDMALMMFINITHKLHKQFLLPDVWGVGHRGVRHRGIGRMGCQTYGVSNIGVSDVWGVRRMGCQMYGVSDIGVSEYIFYIRPTPQLVVTYCIINKKNNLFVQTNTINMIYRLIKSCNHPTSVEVKKFFLLISLSQFKIYLKCLYHVN